MIELKFGTLEELQGTLNAVKQLVSAVPAAQGVVFYGSGCCCDEQCATPAATVADEAPADEAIEDDGEVHAAPLPDGPVAEGTPFKPAGKKRGRKPKVREPESPVAPEDTTQGGNTPIVSDDQLPAATEASTPEAQEPEPDAPLPETKEPEAQVAQPASTLDTTPVDAVALRATCIAIKDALEAKGKDGIELVKAKMREFGSDKAHEIPAEQMAACKAAIEALVNEAS